MTAWLSPPAKPVGCQYNLDNDCELDACDEFNGEPACRHCMSILLAEVQEREEYGVDPEDDDFGETDDSYALESCFGPDNDAAAEE